MTGRPRMAMSSDFLDACARLPRALGFGAPSRLLSSGSAARAAA